ncbi:ABC transporter substrate-binding protein [Sediminibacillus massiliensis]|uniref:ABC transporter substrate-binding protein n=1 Tax=Sediminibacillus massiliensis TaxID=1926277 RepID=UPI00098853B0|nr:extracellular solute-binding protein [Sediminibacillus massiliensis]
MKKPFLVVSFLIIGLLAACNGEDSASGTSENNSSDKDITLKFAWWGEQNRADYTLEVIELFEEENPGITVEPEYASWDDYWRKLAPQAAANQLPDIIQMDLSYIAEYSSNNQIADLTPYVGEQINVDNISENVLSGGEVNGGMYGFNIGTTALSFYYNPEVVEAVGLDGLPEEWSWDDYVNIAKKAAEAGYQAGAGVDVAQVNFNYYLRTKGAALFAEDGKGLGYEDDQLFVDYFSMQKELVDSGAGLTPDEVAQQSGVSDTPLPKGESLGGIAWSTQFPGVQEVADMELDLQNPPASTEETKGVFLKPSMFLSVAENSEHKEAAAKFIDFFVNSIEANKLILADRGIPVSSEVKEALKAEMPEAQAKVFEYSQWVEDNSSPLGPPDPKGAGEVIGALQSVADEIIYGQITPEEGAEKFRNEAQNILAQ